MQAKMMNCPYCNKEVSPEWNMCPHCGYEPVKCSNPNCNSGWLPQEAKFCPVCGNKTNSITFEHNSQEIEKKRKAELEQRKREEENWRKSEMERIERQKRIEESRQTTSSNTLSSNSSKSSSNSIGKRIGRFFGAVLTSIVGFVFITDRSLVEVDGVLRETYELFTGLHFLGAVLLIISITLLISVFKK